MEPETLIDLIEGTEISMTDMIIMTGTTGTDIIIVLRYRSELTDSPE